MNAKYSQRCPRTFAILIAIIMVSSIFPMKNTYAEEYVENENEVIYKDLENLMAEKNTRYAKEGEQLWYDTEGELNNMSFYYKNTGEILSPVVPKTKLPELRYPKELPVIFDKIQEEFGTGFLQQIRAMLGLSSTINTILDGRSYYIYANDTNGNEQWEYYWEDILPGLDEPTIGYEFTSLKGILDELLPIPVPGSLKDIIKTPVDLNKDGTDDFEVSITINLQDPYLVPGVLEGYNIIHAKANIYLEINNINNYPEATIYVGRPIATDNPEQIFLWAVGVGFNNTYPNFSLTATIENFELNVSIQSLISAILSGGDIVNALGNIYAINPPYVIQIEHTNPQATLTSFMIGQGKVVPESNETDEGNFTLNEYNYVFFGDVPRMPTYLRIFLDSSEGWLGPLETVAIEIGNASQPISERTTRVLENLTFIIYEDLHENTTYATYVEIHIANLPSFHLSMQDSAEMNYCIIELDAKEIIKKLQFMEWSYYMRDYTQLSAIDERDGSKDGIINNNGAVDYIYTDIAVENLPKILKINGTVLANITPEQKQGKSTDLISQIFEQVMIEISSKLYYIYKRARSIPLSIVELPTKTGWATIYDLSSPIGKISAIFTTEKYIYWIDNTIDFFACYKEGELQGGAVNTTFGWVTGVSLQITNLTYLSANFTLGSKATLKFTNNTNRFKLVYREDADYAVVEFSNIPNFVRIDLGENNIRFSTEPRIGSIVYTSYVNGKTMQIIIRNVPNEIEIERDKDTIRVKGIRENDYFDIDFFITTSNEIKRISGDHFLVSQEEQNRNMISGSISAIKSFIYNTERGLYLDLNMRGGQKFNVYIVNEIDTNDILRIKGIINPMPASLIIDLPRKITETTINISELLDVGGLSDFGNVVYAISTVGDSILKMLNEATTNLFEEMTLLDSNLTFKYNSSTNIDIIADIWKGRESDKDKEKLSFTHGVNLRKSEENNRTKMNGKIFLTLPKKMDMTINSNPGDLYLIAELDDYSPRYDFLLLDIKGLNDIDALLYLNGLKKNISITINVDLFTISGVGKTTVIGNLDLYVVGKDIDFKNIGQLYLRATRNLDVPMIAEVFIEKIPSSLNIDINVQNDIFIEYRASDEIKYIIINLYKFIAEKWYKAFILLNDLPTKIEFKMESNSKFNMDEFLITQGIPLISINTTSNTLGLYANIEGRVFGRRANIEIEGENITDETRLFVEDGIIKIRSAGKIGFINLRIANYPMSREYLLKSLTLHAEDIQTIDIEIITLFGKYPIIKLSNAKSGKVRLDIQHTILFSEIRFDAKVALIDAMFDESMGFDFPTIAPVQVNSFYTKTTSNTKHYVIIDPISTLIITLLGR